MELVYLWVEEQDFNFSPRFECKFYAEYDEEENLEDDCKLEIKPKEYINIFPSNINITAIVGKNGTGKSTLLRDIRLLHSNFFDGFAIFIDKDNNIFYLGDDTKYKTLKKYTHLYRTKTIRYFPLFDYSFTDSNLFDWSFTYPEKQTNRNRNIFKNEILRNQKNILDNYYILKKNNQLQKFNDFFQPFKIKITCNLESLTLKDGMTFNETSENTYNELKNKLKNKLLIKDTIDTLKALSILLNDSSSYKQTSLEDGFSNSNNFIFPNDYLLGRRETEEEEHNNIWEDKMKDEIKDKFLSKSSLKDIILDEKNINLLKFDIDDLNESYMDILLNSFSSEEFTIELIDKNNKNLNSLSFGEQQLVFILNQIFHLEKDIGRFRDDNDELYISDNFIVLLDEIDIGFHPDWQKRIIQYIIDFLNLLPSKKFHLIFSTHSPFLLSDIPKQNIIFLDKDKKGNLQVVDGLKEKKETFGANIHTLLSDGFFMSDGLMGEFAKGKIDEAIKLLNSSNKLSEDELKYCEQIISIIGEPVIKNQLQRMLDSKRLSKIDTINEKIKNMAYELEILKKYQSKIINDELSDKGKKRYKERFIDDKNSK